MRRLLHHLAYRVRCWRKGHDWGLYACVRCGEDLYPGTPIVVYVGVDFGVPEPVVTLFRRHEDGLLEMLDMFPLTPQGEDQ